MKLSIVIVTYNLKKSLRDCLNSIQAQTPGFPFEVIIIFNGDRTNLTRFKSSFPDYIFLITPRMNKDNAWRFGAHNASGESILFLNEDSHLPKDYLKNINFNASWEVMSGPNQIVKSDSTLLSLGNALASPLCMGSSYKRHCAKAKFNECASDDEMNLGNIIFRSDIINHFDYFKGGISDFLSHLENEGKTFYYEPKLLVISQKEINFEKLIKAFIQSGVKRFSDCLKNNFQNNFFYFLPIIFFIFSVLVIANPTIFVTISFFTFSLSVVLFEVIKFKRLSLKFLLFHYLIILSYDLGLLLGVWKMLNRFIFQMRSQKFSN